MNRGVDSGVLLVTVSTTLPSTTAPSLALNMMTRAGSVNIGVSRGVNRGVCSSVDQSVHEV